MSQENLKMLSNNSSAIALKGKTLEKLFSGVRYYLANAEASLRISLLSGIIHHSPSFKAQ